MAKRLSEERIVFKNNSNDCFGMDENNYDVCHGNTLIGKLITTPWSIFFVVKDIRLELPIPKDVLVMTPIHEILDTIKNTLIDMYHEICYKTDGTVIEEWITFKHRDPLKIGNGPHDYDVYCNDSLIGKLIFPIASAVSNLVPGSNCILFKNGDLMYNTGADIEKLSELDSNELILNEMRENITYLISIGKIKVDKGEK